MSQLFNDKHLNKLLSKDRLEMLNVPKVLDLSQIDEADNMLDIGAGPGVFTIPASKRIGHSVTALDMSMKMTEFLAQRIHDENITNVTIINGTVDHLHDTKFDRIFMIHLLHEISDLSSFVQKVSQLTATGGLITILDWKKEEMAMGPKLEHRISSKEAIELFKTSFEPVLIEEWGPLFYLIILKKR